jgi:hypothetical protein
MGEMIVAFFVGILGHQTDHIIRDWKKTPDTWKQLTRSGIGAIITLPVYMMYRRAMGLSATFQDAAVFILAFVSVGIGVAFGHGLDDLGVK